MSVGFRGFHRHFKGIPRGFMIFQESSRGSQLVLEALQEFSMSFRGVPRLFYRALGGFRDVPECLKGFRDVSEVFPRFSWGFKMRSKEFILVSPETLNSFETH